MSRALVSGADRQGGDETLGKGPSDRSHSGEWDKIAEPTW